MRDYLKLHRQSHVVDWHTHLSLKTAIFHRDLSKDYKRKIFGRSFWPLASRADFPKMFDGGVNVSLSVCYIPELEWADDLPIIKILRWLRPSVWKSLFGAKTYFDASINAFDDVENQIKNFNLKSESQKVVFCRTPDALKNNTKSNNLCVVHAVEGAHSLQGEYLEKYYNPTRTRQQGSAWSSSFAENELLGNLEHLHQRGGAYLTLAHFYPNYVANPVFPYPEYASKFARWRKMLSSWNSCNGLSELGEVVVRRCFELGMIVDICHCTPIARSRVYEIADEMNSKCQVIASHVGAYVKNPDQYNLEDWEIKWIANNGGLISIILMNYWLVPHHTNLGLNEISSVIQHIVDVGGIDCVSLGTDFDGFTDPPDEVEDMRNLPNITMRLASEMQGKGSFKYSDEDISKFLGENSKRVLFEGWRNDY